ncbi:MAG: carboxypeptidase regulatory-like domain-containing protein [Pyrinomonadaceae bacterium]|nr:carboxypeptidase regulatory-like domain-containing protein [Pyrinomonadaceae bacterium]
MYLRVLSTSRNLKFIISAIAVFLTVSFAAPIAQANNKLGIIKGIVRDKSGKPIEKATVAVFRSGTSTLLKQVRSAADGSFIAKILPGKYSILAVAEGFNPVSYSEVEVSRSSELVYRFNLEPAGKGNTLPEKKAERNSSKYPIRAAQIRRSIYQIEEGEVPFDTEVPSRVSTGAVETIEVPLEDEDSVERSSETVVETYFASSERGNYSGVNFATLLPVIDKAQIVVSGQTGTGNSAAKRLETSVSFNAGPEHKLRFKGSIVNLGKFKTARESDGNLGQFSVQALDEWKVREGIVFVYGIDYSRFIGADGDSISPRLGFQFDVNPTTRVKASYTSGSEERTWQRALELEDTQVLFREPVSVSDIVFEDDRPQMNKNRRLEFGIEKVLSNRSNLEANFFFDAITGRGVGLVNLPFESLGSNLNDQMTASQHGKSQGFRVVYTRRINGMFTASAGYSAGNGQKLSSEGFTDPSEIFTNGFFQTVVGQLDADLKTGTNVKTVFRLSPQATVFAIDPFAGRLAIYDPSLSIFVTQALPTLGLPIRAEAIVDARNIFDVQPAISGEDGILRLTSQGMVLRGGISVRF